MKKYNRGVTIVEILLSILIIGIVLLILFSMLSNVRHEDENNQIQSQYVINQSTFVEAMQEDIINYGVARISECNVYNLDLSAENINPTNKSQFKCLRFDFQDDYLVDKVGYLMIYNYYTKYEKTAGNNYQGTESKWMIRYIRGHYETPTNEKKNEWHTLNAVMNEIPDTAVLTNKISVKYTTYNVTATSNNSNAVYINIPIISKEGEYYDINLSFLYQAPGTFSCIPGTGLTCKNV